MDNSSGVIWPTFDQDTGMLYCPGKGEGNIKYYEYANQNITYLNNYSSTIPQKSICWFPKRAMNYFKSEQQRAAKLTNNSIEYVSFRVPKRVSTCSLVPMCPCSYVPIFSFSHFPNALNFLLIYGNCLKLPYFTNFILLYSQFYNILSPYQNEGYHPEVYVDVLTGEAGGTLDEWMKGENKLALRKSIDQIDNAFSVKETKIEHVVEKKEVTPDEEIKQLKEEIQLKEVKFF